MFLDFKNMTVLSLINFGTCDSGDSIFTNEDLITKSGVWEILLSKPRSLSHGSINHSIWRERNATAKTWVSVIASLVWGRSCL
jgi:hypothetical protein